MKKILIFVLCLALVLSMMLYTGCKGNNGFVIPKYGVSPATSISADWSGGNLVFYNGSGTAILTLSNSGIAAATTFKYGSTSLAAGGQVSITHGLGSVPSFAMASYNGTPLTGATSNISSTIYPYIYVYSNNTTTTVFQMYPAANVTVPICYIIVK